MSLTRLSWYCLPLTILLSLILGPILRDGMFLDGLVYTNIAKNMADGVGSMWEPQVFKTGLVFYEHPVLLPWLESGLFRFLGDWLFTEDLYNFSVLALTIWVMYRLWSRIVNNNQRWLFFFPLLLWLLNQEVQLRYPNGMLECGLTLITLLTVWSYLILQNRSSWLAEIIVGVGALLAFCAKGPVGLFVLAVPFLHHKIILDKWSIRALILPAVMAALATSLLIFIEPAAGVFFKQYLEQQVFAALAGKRVENIADSRFDFLFWFIALNLPALIIAAATAFIPQKKANRDGITLRWAILLLVIGATAIVPLVVSIKQATYYQLPSLPYFFLGLGLLLLSRVERMTTWLRDHKSFRIGLSIVGIIGVLVSGYVAISMLGTTDRRDREIVVLVSEINHFFRGSDERNYELLLSGDIPSAANRSYRLTNFLARYHDIHLNQVSPTPVILMIRHGGDEQPEGTEVLWKKDGLLLMRKVE